MNTDLALDLEYELLDMCSQGDAFLLLKAFLSYCIALSFEYLNSMA